MNPLKPYLYGGALLLALGLAGYVMWLQHSRETYKASAEFEQSEKVKAIQTIAKIQESANKDRKLLEGYQNVKAEIQYVDKIVTKEVIRYRDIVTTRFVIPDEFVRAYNTSTESVHIEGAATGTDGSTTTLRKIVNDADLLQVVTANNRICVKQAAQLTALQIWASPPN